MTADQLRDLVRRSRRPRAQLERLAVLVKLQPMKDVLNELADELHGGDSESSEQPTISTVATPNADVIKPVSLHHLGADLSTFFM